MSSTMERRLIYSDVAHQVLLDGGDIEDVPTAKVKQLAVAEYKAKLLKEIIWMYEHEYPTASGEFDEFYRAVLKLVKEG